MKFWMRIAVVAILLGIALAFTFERPPIETVQNGFRGVGQFQVYNSRKVRSADQANLNKVPEPQAPVDKAGVTAAASGAYQNVQVLKDVDSNEFLRIMAAITEWVAPENGEEGRGCAYCHNVENMADDTKYSHKVARRMFQMTQTINVDWKNHVQNTGVTCYTCHRGHPVPQNIWYAPSVPERSMAGLAGDRAGQNKPGLAVGIASLPSDPFTPFLERDLNIRLASNTALPNGNHTSIKQAEWTYGLMMHFSKSLGVNCTYCHNTRNFASWDQASPQRANAWYGIRMVREINNKYITPLTPVYAGIPNRHGPMGDIAKANCTTCHQGAFKPFYGASMLQDYPDLGRRTDLQKAAVITPAVTPAPVIAEKKEVDSASVFRIDGKDSGGKRAAFDYVILTDDYTWVIGSAVQVVSKGQQVPQDQTAQRVITPQLRTDLERATDVIAVGVASYEGQKAEEETRADNRGNTIVSWLDRVVNPATPIWKLNLGQYDKNACRSQEQAGSSFQRPLMFASVRAKDDGVNLQEALADAISGKANLPSRGCYSRFDLSKVR
jgi:photosynthetic reaction center cytochrome c subunit